MSHLARSALALALGFLGAMVAACRGGDGTGTSGPTPGTLSVVLATPNTDDGAILFRVSGPDMSQVSAGDATLYFRQVQQGTTITAVVVGNLHTGTLLTFHVPDVDAASSYSATILQVADRANALRGTLGGYGLMVRE